MTSPSSSVRARPKLLARSVELERDCAEIVDLLEHLGDDGFAWLGDDRGFVTAGVALEIEPRDAAEALAAITHERIGGASMHRGVLRPLYYIYKMIFSMGLIYMRARGNRQGDRTG